jgi:hypothetical protein
MLMEDVWMIAPAAVWAVLRMVPPRQDIAVVVLNGLAEWLR